MKKLYSGIIGLAAIAVIAEIGGAKFIGSQIKPYSEKLQNESDFYALTIDQVTSGWFSSTITTELALQTPAASEEDTPLQHVTIPLTHKIHHGPFVFGVEGHNPLTPVRAVIETSMTLSETDQAVAASANTPNPVNGLTVIDIYGRGNSTLTIQKISREYPAENAQLEWNGLTANSTFNLDHKNFTTQIDAGSIKLVKNNGELLIENLSADADVHLINKNLWTGNLNYKADSISASGEAADKIPAIKGIRISATSKFDPEDQYHSHIAFNIDEFSHPSFPTSSIAFGINTGRWDKEGLIAIQDKFEEAEQQHLSNDEMQMAAFMAIQNNAKALLKHAPYFDITPISLNTTEGEMKADAHVVLETKDKEIPDNLFELFPWLNAEINFSTPKALMMRLMGDSYEKQIAAQYKNSEEEITEAQQKEMATMLASQQIDNLATQGLIVINDGQISSKILLKEGMADVNGQLYPAFQMFQ